MRWVATRARERFGRRLRKEREARSFAPPVCELKTVVIGVGAQKAGTSWLANALRSHPDVHMRRKEVRYWDAVRAPYRLGAMKNIWPHEGAVPKSPIFGADLYDHGNYLRFLSEAREASPVCLEVSPSYALCSAETMRDMAAIHSDVRLIFLMRDPVARLWSGIRHTMRHIIDRRPDRDVARRAFCEAYGNPFDPHMQMSRYEVTLDALETSGARHISLFYEELFRPETMAKIYDFIGVPASQSHRFNRRSNVGAMPQEGPSEAEWTAARQALSPTYDAVRARAGALPEEWCAYA